MTDELFRTRPDTRGHYHLFTRKMKPHEAHLWFRQQGSAERSRMWIQRTLGIADPVPSRFMCAVSDGPDKSLRVRSTIYGERDRAEEWYKQGGYPGAWRL